jgi:thioester reductase-like protein
MNADKFAQLLPRFDLYLGDITAPNLGLIDRDWESLRDSTESIIHAAAILNRKSHQACVNVNVRGTLDVIQLACAANVHHGLRRFSLISSVAVAGQRQDEVVTEAEAIQWDRPDYDPYGATKKLAEYLVQTLLPDISYTIFRPSTVLGDSRFGKTTQFDTARALVLLARTGIIPLQPHWRMDIISADFVGRAIATLHQQSQITHSIYHLSAGTQSLTYREILTSLKRNGLFLPALQPPFEWLVKQLAATPRTWKISRSATLLKVFMPYLTFNTVFDNQRIIQELGEAPSSFRDYGATLYRFLEDHHCQFPYQPTPMPLALTSGV